MNGELKHHGVKGMKWGVRKSYMRARRAGSKAHASHTRLENKKSKLDRKISDVTRKINNKGAFASKRLLDKKSRLDQKYKDLDSKSKSHKKEFDSRVAEAKGYGAVVKKRHRPMLLSTQRGKSRDEFDEAAATHIFQRRRTRGDGNRPIIEQGGNDHKNNSKKINKLDGNVNKIKRMSDEEITSKLERIRLENNLKRLSSNLKDRSATKVYKNRAKYSNESLRKLNNRLQLEDELRQQTALANAKTSLGMFAMAKKIMKDTAMRSAINYVHGSDVNIKGNFKEITYKVVKDRIKDSKRLGDFGSDLGVAYLNRITSRDLNGNKVKKEPKPSPKKPKESPAPNKHQDRINELNKINSTSRVISDVRSAADKAKEYREKLEKLRKK